MVRLFLVLLGLGLIAGCSNGTQKPFAALSSAPAIAPVTLQPSPPSAAPAALPPAAPAWQAGLNIAIPPFSAVTPETAAIGQRIADVIAADLRRGGHFPGNIGMPPPQPPQDKPDFDTWKAAGALALLTGSIKTDPQGHTRIEARLWDPQRGTNSWGRGYTTLPGAWRRVAHLIADDVQKTLTGLDGTWDSRIVYIAQNAQGKRRLAIMDQDGANHAFLTTPLKGLHALRNEGNQEIGYTATTESGPVRYALRIETARRRIIPDTAMTEWPAPNGTAIAFLRPSGQSMALWIRHPDGNGERSVANDVIADSVSWAANSGKLIFARMGENGTRLYAVDLSNNYEYPVPTPWQALGAVWHTPQ